MATERRGSRLTIFVGEYDRLAHRAVTEVIVERAREEGLAGATVLRGIEGFGASSTLHTTRLLSASDDLPMVIEIVDEADRIDAFLPLLDGLVTEGLVTVEDVVLRSPERPSGPPARRRTVTGQARKATMRASGPTWTPTGGPRVVT